MKYDINKVFEFFETQEPFSIDKINWWLLKYAEFYKNTFELVYSQQLFDFADGSTIRLPSFGKATDEEFFLDLYKALDRITEFHRDEKYFEQEMINYYKIKNSKTELKNWVAKNEDLGASKYVCFLIDYLDYDENNEEKHLYIYLGSNDKFEVYINRKDFRSTIEFLKIFNELYWVQEILPKNLDKT